MKTRGYLLVAALGIALVVLGGSAAQADTFKISIAGARLENLGNDGTQGTTFDILDVNAFAGSLLVVPDVPLSADTNPFVFSVGYNRADNAYVSGITLTRTFSFFDEWDNLLGQGTLSQSGAVDINAADTLYLFEGTTTEVSLADGRLLRVTPLASTIASGVGSTEGTLATQFTLVPEPATLSLLGLGLVGLARAARRRR